MMKSRLVACISLLCAFIAGALVVTPVARAVQALGRISCSSSLPCSGGVNASNGPGVSGTSVNGNGAVGATKYISTAANDYRSGLVGEDLSPRGVFDTGVLGTSPRGYGVIGWTKFASTSSSASKAGILGEDLSTAGTYDAGVKGITANGNGVFAEATKSGGVAINARNDSTGTGIFAISGGEGIEAETSGTIGQKSAFVGISLSGTDIYQGYTQTGSYLTQVGRLDGSGNITITGKLYTQGSCSTGCARHQIRSYGAQAAAPVLEDTGEAQLRSRVAYVPLDPAFAQAIDARRGYYVLITPESATNQLYVAQRGAAGFTVRETGGHSNGPFAYRIVAHPYGATEPRLPLVDIKTKPLRASN